MFCGPIFTKEARDTTKEWASVKALANRYKKSLTTTLRRYVEHGHDHPMLMLVSTPYWRSKPTDQPERWRHFVRSKKFMEQFSNVRPSDVLVAVDDNSNDHRRWQVANFIFVLNDDNGVSHEFHVESIDNTHDLLTLCVQIQKCTAKRIIVPNSYIS